jgi:succinoglycan biosynthesis protein ExoM
MPKIAVLICTFNRHALLARLLSALQLELKGHDAEVVVADNGTSSARHLLLPFSTSLKLHYSSITERGLVSARNAAVRKALSLSPEFLVFIDDDEIPLPGWISHLLQTMSDSRADFANGPVVPLYAVEPPRWATQGSFFHAEGDSLRTSNLIMRAAALPSDETQWFQPEFNFSGGEDNELLSRLKNAGAVHAVAAAALVQEIVPESRMRRRYIWRRGLRDGVTIGQIITLRGRSGVSIASAVLCRSAAKLAYGLNHLFWSAFMPWRFNCAMADFAAAGSIILSAAGVKFTFYGADCSTPV